MLQMSSLRLVFAMVLEADQNRVSGQLKVECLEVWASGARGLDLRSNGSTLWLKGPI